MAIRANDAEPGTGGSRPRKGTRYDHQYFDAEKSYTALTFVVHASLTDGTIRHARTGPPENYNS